MPWPATLAPGRQVIRGIASSPQGPIAQVLWNADDQPEWHPALIVSPALPTSWAWFEFGWDAGPGEHTLRVRATDAAGNTQPESVPFNAKGYLLNVVLPHPVRVT